MVDTLMTREKIDINSLVSDSMTHLDQVSEALSNNVSDSIIHGALNADWAFIHEFSSAYPYLERQFNLSDDKNRRIYYYGVWKTLIELLKKANQYNQKIEDHQAVVKQYRRLAETIEILFKSKYKSHGELASDLEMSPNSLTNFIRRISNFKYLAVNKVGKKKIYYLTYKGQELYKYLARNKQVTDKNIKHFNLIFDLLASVNTEMRNNEPQAYAIIKTIDHYLPLNINEKKLLLIQIESIFRRVEWMSVSARKLASIKSQDLQNTGKQRMLARNIQVNVNKTFETANLCEWDMPDRHSSRGEWVWKEFDHGR